GCFGSSPKIQRHHAVYTWSSAGSSGLGRRSAGISTTATAMANAAVMADQTRRMEPPQGQTAPRVIWAQKMPAGDKPTGSLATPPVGASGLGYSPRRGAVPVETPVHQQA